MVQRFNPRAYQAPAIEHIIKHPRCALFIPMGGGKTVSTLTALNDLSIVDNVYPVLVIAPKRVATSTWPDEVNKWDHLKHLSVSAILGSAEQRLKALYRKADIYTINYENIPWLVEKLAGEWPFKTIVADESTKLKSFRLRKGSMRAKALAKVAHQSERFIGLTGTPSPNGIKDLWGQLYFVDKGKRLGRSFESFRNRWFRAERVGTSEFAVELVPLDHAQDEIQERIRDVCLSVDVAKYLDIKEPITNNIYVDLPPNAHKLYKDMEREMFLEIKGLEVEAFNAASKTMKCLQLASGAIYTDESGAYQTVHDAKIEALESIIEEACGMPVLVAYHFKSDLERLLKALPQGRQLDSNAQTLRDWNAGKIPVLFAHPASAGHGLNMQNGGNIIAFFSHNWNLEEYQQIIERIGPTRQAQAGYDRPVFIYHIIARNTIDDVVIERRETKREVQDLLLEAMERWESLKD